jgi:hypothetical protein
MKDVKRINEWKDASNNITHVEIVFTDGSKVTYTVTIDGYMERKGTL